LVRVEQEGDDELEALALQGLSSGAAVQIDTGYWEEKHRRLEERLKNTR
jgi:hypothetical protein